MTRVTVFVALVLGLILSYSSGVPLVDSPHQVREPSNSSPPLTKANEVPNPRIEALDLLLRITRQATNTNNHDPSIKNPCKYRKGTWSACDPKTKLKTRTFTLKKGDSNVCQTTKTLQRECKGNRKGGRGKTGPKNRVGKTGNSNRTKTT